MLSEFVPIDQTARRQEQLPVRRQKETPFLVPSQTENPPEIPIRVVDQGEGNATSGFLDSSPIRVLRTYSQRHAEADSSIAIAVQ